MAGRLATLAKSATDAWRKALIWLEAGKSDLSLFQAFLNVKPNDAAIRARVAGLNQAFAPKPLDASIALRDGFNALNVGMLKLNNA